MEFQNYKSRVTCDLADVISYVTTYPNLTFNEPTGPEELAYFRPRGKRAAHRYKNFNSYIDFICCSKGLPTELISIICDLIPFVDQTKRVLVSSPVKEVIPPKSKFQQEREEQDKAYEESLRNDQQKERLAQEKSHIIQSYPALIKEEEEVYERLNVQAREKTRQLQQLRYDLQINPQNQEKIDVLTTDLAALTNEINSISHAIDEIKAKLEEAKKKE